MAGFELLDPSDIVLTKDDFPELTDDELTRQALEADPNAPADPEAIPLYELDERGDLLPAWYMPAPVARSNRRSKLAVIVLIIAALLTIVASGFCVTYGALTVA